MLKDCSLDGVIAKLDRAHEQTQLLEGEFDRFVQVNRNETFGTTIEANHHRREFRTRWAGHPEVPLRWPVIVGEIFHNFRSALDHLAWQLVLCNGGQPGRHTEFPIFKSKPEFDSAAPRKMRGMSNEAKAIIERLQPFVAYPEHPTSTTLWHIHAVNVADKHRLLALVDFWMDQINLDVMATQRHKVRIVEHWVADRIRLEPDTELGRLRFEPISVSPGETVYVEFEAFLDIAINEGPYLDRSLQPIEGGMAVRQQLHTTQNYFRYDVLPKFASFF